MLDLLSNYLDRAATPEEKLMLADAIDSLENVGFEDYEGAIEEILMTDDEVDQGATLDAIVRLIRGLLYQVLDMHAVKVSSEAKMPLLTDLIDGIMLIQNYEGKSEIEQILSLEVSVRERFCHLMQITTNHNVDELLLYIDKVSPSLLARLQERHEEEETFDSEEVIAARREMIRRFQAYDVFLPHGAPARARAIIAAGIDVGKPFATYAGTVGSEFEQMQVEEIAEEMFGMAIISSDGGNRPQDIIKQHIEEYIADPLVITGVFTRVNQLVTGFKP